MMRGDIGMKLKKHIKILLIVTIMLSCILSTISVSASQYVLTQKNGYVSIPKPYTVENVIMYIDGLEPQLNNPTDIFIKNSNLYIVDAKNARIVVIDKQGKLINTFGDAYGDISNDEAVTIMAENKAAAFNKENPDKEALHKYTIANARRVQKLNSPQGVYVDSEGDMYIADTNNQRIVHLAADGKYVESFYQPREDTYDTQYPFNPTKVYIDAVGRLYIINKGDYHGLISIDADNTFLGYLAASRVKLDPLYEFYSLFMTQEQLDALTRETPPYFTNFIINPENGLTYAVQRDAEENQIQVITPAGDNIYTKGKHFGYTTLNEQTKEILEPMFNDIAVSKDGIIYASDSTNQEIYAYDQEANNLAIFGGKGNAKGYFQNISSIAIDDDGTLYVADGELNIIQVLEPTLFMSKISTASSLYTDGRYEDALAPWREVLDMHSTYEMAIRGVAKAEFGRGNYQEAMDLSIIADDQEGYSEPFAEYRLDFTRRNFNYIMIGIIIFIILIFFLLKFLLKKAKNVVDRYDYTNDKTGIALFFDTMLLSIFHPLDGLEKLKQQRDRYKIWHIITLILLIIIVRISYIFIVHFPLADKLPQQTDFWQELITFFIPLTLWIIMNFALTSISDGKTTFKEVIVSSLYSFTPYIIFSLPLALLSRIMSTEEQGLYSGLKTIIMIWCVILILLSTMKLNEYSFGKTVGTVFLVLFGIIVVVMVIGIFYVLLSQFLTFVGEINQEIIYLRQ